MYSTLDAMKWSRRKIQKMLVNMASVRDVADIPTKDLMFGYGSIWREGHTCADLLYHRDILELSGNIGFGGV